MTAVDALRATIAANLADVRARIAAAAARAERDPATVTLIAVTKTFPVEAVVAALAAGVRDIGENRVQEGEAKRDALEVRATAPEQGFPAHRPIWHLIGHLQTNKIKPALRSFDILHSIDSLRLAEQVNRNAVAPVDVLLEVNVAGEASKYGFAPDEVLGAVMQLSRLEHLRPRGLMTVAPIVADPEEVRPVFRRLRALRDAAGLAELSMGMTHDFEVAIEQGATMVRVGRAIFGERVTRDA
jgi:pyridoxal phosphate enzyme (YggS family)